MPDVKWIKIVTDIFDNRKIKQIRKMPEGDAIIGVWLQILCLAGTINDVGMIYITKDLPYTDETLSNEFDRPLSTIRLALDTFRIFNMIEIVDNFLLVSNWEEYQNADALQRMRENNRLRNAKYRENKRLLLTQARDVSVMSRDAVEKSKRREEKSINIGADKPPTRQVFKPPSLEEITAYCKERKNDVCPERFHDFYAAKGWMVGKNKMKDWKACVRTWEQGNKASPQKQKFDYVQHGYTAEHFEKDRIESDEVLSEFYEKENQK